MSNKVLKYIILGGIFTIPFVPLIVTPSLFFPFITGKAFAFRLIVQIIFACWLVLALRDTEYRPKFSWIMAGLAAFTAVMGLATIFAENPFKAFWSNFERMEGYITILHLFAYFLVLSSVTKTQILWNRLIATSVGASVIMAVYSFFQLAGKITINQGGVRVDGTLGNAGYLGIYMVFHIFLASLLYFRSKRLEQKIILVVVAVMNLIVLYYTATRGAIIGLIGGAFVSFLMLLSKSVKGDNIRKVGAGGLIVILVFLGLFFAFKNTDYVENHPVLSRFSSLSTSEIKSQGRYFVWPMAYSGFIEKPILGWGQEGFNFVFNKNYDPRMYAQEPWFDRVHNTYLDWLIAGGLLGALSYLAIFGALIYHLFKTNEEVLTKQDKAVLVGLVSAYGFNNFFVFDQIASYIMFFLILAYVHSHATESKLSWWDKISAKCKNIFSNEKMHPVFEATVLILLVISIFYFIYLPWKNNKDLLAVLRFNAMGEVGTLDDYARPFQKYRMGFPESLEHVSQTAVALNNNPGVPNDIKLDIFDIVEKGFKKHIEKVPNDARYRLFYGMFLSRFGWYGKALEQYDIAQKLSPRKQSIYFERISNLLMDNKPAEALVLAREAYELEPNYIESKIVYAFTASSVGQNDLAVSLINEIDENNYIFDDRYLSVLININQIERALNIVNTRIESNPENIQHRITLTAVYLQANRRVEAINTLQKIIELEPAFKEQGEYYINEIRAGRNP
jgi:O-antigen ligase/tetratricopeptide (TPR) repeat protein